MMRTTSKLLKSLAVLSALLPLCTPSWASIVYDNSINDLNRVLPAANGVEVGDEINLAGVDRQVTELRFEYFLSGNANGNETAQLFVRANDGPVLTRVVDGTTVNANSPGTLLYTSPVLTLAVGIQTADAFGFTPFTAPDTFTWSVVFQGIDANEVAGLRVYDPPTIGSSFADFWENNAGTWNTYLLDNPPTPGNFAARVTAVPEPTTLSLVLLAGFGWLGFLGFKRRS